MRSCIISAHKLLMQRNAWLLSDRHASSPQSWDCCLWTWDRRDKCYWRTVCSWIWFRNDGKWYHWRKKCDMCQMWYVSHNPNGYIFVTIYWHLQLFKHSIHTLQSRSAQVQILCFLVLWSLYSLLWFVYSRRLCSSITTQKLTSLTWPTGLKLPFTSSPSSLCLSSEQPACVLKSGNGSLG